MRRPALHGTILSYTDTIMAKDHAALRSFREILAGQMFGVRGPEPGMRLGTAAPSTPNGWTKNVGELLPRIARRSCVMLSARNQFVGTVKSVRLGGIMAEIIVQVGDLEIVSAITRSSAESLQLEMGDTVKAVIKSTEVLIDK
jgi:molybdopterin-binding protein